MIKILFLAANPIDTDRLHLDEEMRSIDAAMRRPAGTLATSPTRHDIVHFSGHGSSTSEIILQDEQGNSVIVPRDMVAAFRQRSS